jgi:Na+/H+ antiporter NhaC
MVQLSEKHIIHLWWVRNNKFGLFEFRLSGCSLLIFGLFFLLSTQLFADELPEFEIEKPPVVLSDINFKLQLTPGIKYYTIAEKVEIPYRVVWVDSQKTLAEGISRLDASNPVPFEISGLEISHSGKNKMTVFFGDAMQEIEIRALPAFISILPPLLAILVALITRQVIVALFFGIWLGATFVFGYNPITGFFRTLDHYIIQAVATEEHVYIITFSLVLGGMVGVITRSGGTQGIVEKLSQYAKNSRGGQFATWLMGVLIFFDDYANTLIVGNTMRPLSDQLRISREKLSYLVDSTAAPVANIAIISTWIGYEISLISQSFDTLGIDSNAYITFLQSIPYNFYPLYTLLFGLLIALLLRDFGPMWRAEYRAKSTGQVLRAGAAPLANLTSDDIIADETTPKRWYNAMVPVLGIIIVVSVGLFVTGWSAGWEKIVAEASVNGEKLTEVSFIRKVSAIVGAADSFAVLMWGSFIGSIVAIIMAISQRLLTLHQSLDAWVGGIRSMMMAAVILTAAWAIGNICRDLFTADYVVHLTKTFLSPHWLPLLIFLSAGVIAFATGTSWGTMAILMPIAIPLAYKFPQQDPTIVGMHETSILLSTIAAVLAGATFGDHCSPISDTTIMSSMASRSSMASSADHIDHVRTQLPYAVTAATIACAFGYIPVGFGVSNWVVLPIGMVITFLIVRFVGKKVE